MVGVVVEVGATTEKGVRGEGQRSCVLDRVRAKPRSARCSLRDLYAAVSTRLDTPGRPATDPKILLALWVYTTSEAERGATIETVNADLRAHRGLQRLPVRGRNKAKALALLHALTFNLLRIPRGLLAMPI